MRPTIVWLWQLRVLWWGFAVFVACVAAIALTRPFGYMAFERSIRVCGLLLQLVAVGTALVGLHSARRLFDLPPLREVFRTWWRSAPWNTGRSGYLSGHIVLSPATASGSMHSWAESNNSLPDAARIAALEQRTAALLELTNNLRAQGRADLQALREEIVQSLAEHQTTTAVTALKLQRFAIDGAATAAVGLACAFIGIVLASASPEIARRLG